MGKTTLLVAWRRARQAAGDAVVLSMAYPQTPDSFLAGLATPSKPRLHAPRADEWTLNLGSTSSSPPPGYDGLAIAPNTI